MFAIVGAPKSIDRYLIWKQGLYETGKGVETLSICKEWGGRALGGLGIGRLRYRCINYTLTNVSIRGAYRTMMLFDYLIGLFFLL
jgi:hypothetical protein